MMFWTRLEAGATGFAAVAGATGRLAEGTGRFTPPKLLKELDASAGATPTPRATAAASAGATNFLAQK